MALLKHRPSFDAAGAAAIAHDLFGVTGAARPLPGERDQNFAIDGPSGRYVLKISNALEERAMLEAENAAMAHLASRGLPCPQPVTVTGRSILVEPGGHAVRLLTWIPGVPMASCQRHGDTLLAELGGLLGNVDAALASFDHPAIHRRFHWDLAAGLDTIAQHLHLVRDGRLRALVEREAAIFERVDAPRMAACRRSAIHNDANDFNVLVGGGTGPWTRNQHVTGLIDFGDMVHGATVGDAAVACAYAVLGKRDPLRTATGIVAGYHRAYPLQDTELATLFGLLKLRLCVSVCIAADQQQQRPDDEYLGISQAGIARTLPLLSNIPARLAEAHFRVACGLVPSPRAARIAAAIAGTAAPPVVPGIHRDSPILDLGVSGALVAGDPAGTREPELTRRIESVMREAGAAVAIGRYGETRLLYSSDLFAADGDERRTVHLGVDLFAPAGTPVRAPLAGSVHAFADNRASLDYGPVVILSHRTADGDEFYTLYGHLSRESLGSLRLGQQVAAGEQFAALGAPAVNGGWPPHLHVQVITDLLDLGCDFPGVCRASEQTAWRALSPDPVPTLGLGAEAAVSEGGTARTLARRRQTLGRNLSVGYREPLKIVRGWMQYLYDDRGRRYLDGYNNVPHVGHTHPSVVRAASGQLAILNTNTRYLHDAIEDLAERLTATLPAPLRICYFVNSGSEANELALRLARAHTRRRDVVVLEAGYHGNTTTLIDISPYKFDGPGGEGPRPGVHVAPLPDVYRGPHRGPAAASEYAAGLARVISTAEESGARVAAFIAETCPSVAGQIVLPDGYLRGAYDAVRRAGGLCIADEVQTAYGRMGSSFYAFQDQNVVPDIVVLGKPIGNGYPLGAVVTTEEIARSFDNGMEFFSTFGGSTVSCTVGLAVLTAVQQEKLQEHAATVGALLLDRLRDLQRRHSVIGDVRGSGLFLGAELVKDHPTRQPATDEADYVVNRLREEGILIGTDGPFHNVLKIRPPMPFAAADASLLADALDAILSEL